MILTRAQELRHSLDKKQKAEREKLELKSFQNRRDELDKYVRRTAEIIKTLRVLRIRRIVEAQWSQPEGKYVLQLLQEAQSKFVTDSEWIIGQSALDELKRNLDSYLKKLADSLKKVWKEFCRLNLPMLPDDVLQVLGQISSYREDVALIRKHLQDMQGRAEILPNLVSDVDAFMELKQEIDEAWQRLGQGELPEDVLKFLKSASSKQGAGLHLLTPEVVQWLESNHLQSSFSVQLRQ